MHLSSAPRGFALLFKFPPRWLILDQIELLSFYYTGTKVTAVARRYYNLGWKRREKSGEGRIHANFVLRPLNLPPFHRTVLCIISRELDPLQWFTLGTAIKLTLAIILLSVKISYLLFSIYIYIYVRWNILG